MKKQFVTAGFVLLSFMLPLKANAAGFGAMYVFGDSLSDTGNTFNATGGTYPPSPLYSPDFPGRFSNGQIWVDYLADRLKINQPTLVTAPKFPNGGVNFAYGGARSGSGNAFIPGLPGVLEQVKSFAANNPKADPKALYTVWGGGNDFIFPNSNPSDSTPPADNISQALNILAGVGAKNILVFNLPDLSQVPLFQGNGAKPVQDAVKNYNTTLKQTLDGLSNNPNLNIISVNTYSLFDQVRKSPGIFDLTNATDSCRVQTSPTTYKFCSNPNDYLFWDEVHPTTAGHKLIADTALAAIEAKSVPEPSTALGTLAIAAWGTAAVIKRRRKQPGLTIVGRVPGGQSTRIKVES